MGTKFSAVYNCFLGKITDDMYMELTPEDTLRDLQSLLIDAIPGFEFPRKNLNDYTIDTAQIDGITDTEKYITNDNSCFYSELTNEEIDILACLMKQGWVQRQVTSIENIRMKFSGSDFKFTSQANHLAKLMSLLTESRRDALHKQRLYKRRKMDANGAYTSNWSIFGHNNGNKN